jgi:tetratricopeptide (TPR) repeat protein
LPHDWLGFALQSKKGDLDGAIAEYRKAVRLDPKSVSFRHRLGNALRDKGDLDGAIAQYREAMRLNPESAWIHFDLGWTLYCKGDPAGAIAAYREALRLDPKQPKALVYLPRAQQMRELLPRLPDVLAGQDKPKSPAETYAFGHICSYHSHRYVDAVRLFAEAFAADLNLAADLKAWNRCDAAGAAVLGGCGKSKDSAKLKDKDRARLREQALKWLHADLALHRQHASAGESALRRDAAAELSHWLRDWDLVGVRPGPYQIAMPAEERAAWDALWADVKATLAEAKKPAPPPRADAGKK